MKKSHYGSMVFFVSAFFVAYAFCLNTAGAVFAENVKTTLHVSDVEITFAIGAFIFGFACMQIPAGFLLDRFNARFILIGALLFLVLGNAAVSMASNIYIFSLANLIQGMGASFDFIGASILVSQ